MLGRDLLATACGIAAVAMGCILWRLLSEYVRGSLTARTVLVGGALLAAIGGLFASGVQTLIMGPGL